MKKTLIQKDSYQLNCLTCGKKNKPAHSYCSAFCRRKFTFLFFENGELKASKTDEQIRLLSK